jgi:fructose-1,6-bisphosphatase II
MPYRDLALEMVRLTELAAISASFFVGKGDKEGGDGAAVDAMRYYLNSLEIKGTIVIGEGEKDDAPMLYNGEQVGTGEGPELDIAVDPVEGTTLLAKGQPNAIATIAFAERGSMLRVGSSFYMDKIVVPHAAKHAIDISKTPTENVQNIAKALDKQVRSLTISVLDRPRNQHLIEELRDSGVRILLISHGDVASGVSATISTRGVDALFGIGGTPEAIITAAAVKALDGGMQCKRAPQSYQEGKRLESEGVDLEQILTLDDLISCKNTFFAATGITTSNFLRGVEFSGHNIVTTQSIVMRSRSGTIRWIDGIHDLNRKLSGEDFQVPWMK